MTKLQQHFLNFQILQTKESKIEYLKQQQTKLSEYNINVQNLIKAWETNNWPWNNKIKEDPDRIGF
tara:strand:- start:593 stop:790 length:198 start_codon:yes stop_codon:yes gene_type:complete